MIDLIAVDAYTPEMEAALAIPGFTAKRHVTNIRNEPGLCSRTAASYRGAAGAPTRRSEIDVPEQLRLVAVLSRVAILWQRIAAALVGFAAVRIFRSNRDTPGLVPSLQPDAIVVDDPDQAESAVLFAPDEGATPLHIFLHDRRSQIYGRDGWEESAGEGAPPEAIRNVIAGALYGRGER